MIGSMGLNDHFTGTIGSPGTSSHLQDKLRHPLAGPEVGTEQSLVGIENTDQCHLGKVVPLGQHLGTDQNSGFAAMNLLQQRLHRTFAAGRVTIDTYHPNTGKPRLQYLFNPLRPLPQRAQIGTTALGALPGYRAFGATVVATHPALTAVIGQAGIAAWTVGYLAAI